MSLRHLLFLFLLLFSFVQLDCKKDPVTSLPAEIIVSTEDIGVTEVILSVKTQNISLPQSITLQRNNAPLISFTLTTTDTVIIDSTAKPKQLYNYKVILGNGDIAEVRVTTMDTTSHAFNWQTFTFGGESGTGSSALYDVAIVNDTLAYAVGEIYVKDSSGKEITYNALKWDGQSWNLQKILVRDWGGGSGYAPLYTVYDFGPNNVWFASDADLIQWNGSTYTSKAFFMTSMPFNGQVRKMWGTSDNNIYCVGRGGAIYHYNGNNWTKLESGTTTTIQDVWGSVDTKTGDPFILCSVSNLFDPGDKKLLSIQNPTVKEYYTTMERRISSTWFKNERTIFRTGGGVFVRGYKKEWDEVTELPLNYSYRVRGIDVNDLFVVAGFGMVAHHNGVDWKMISETNHSDIYESCDYQSRTFIAVGTEGLKAVITIGRHQ